MKRIRSALNSRPTPGRRNVQTRVGTFGSRKEAERTLTAWLADLDKGIAIEPMKLRLSDLLRRWLHDEAAARVRPTTLAGYRATIEHHVIPLLEPRAKDVPLWQDGAWLHAPLPTSASAW
jgi:Phage integrase, N-terminal SAM-like domain